MCKISIIVPYFNRQDTILRALESIKNQTYKDYETILIDDGSKDQSKQIVDNFINENPDLRMTNLVQINQGPSEARNNGIRAAKGEVIAFLDSDDEWLPEKLEKQIQLMEELNIDMLGCNYNLVINGSKQRHAFIDRGAEPISFRKLLFKHYYATPCVIVKREALMDIGLFPMGQKYMEDAYVFASVARKYKAYMSSDCLVNIYKMPYGDGGLSAELRQMEKYELLNFKKFRADNKRYDEKLGTALYCLTKIFSYMKYVRRSVIVKIRNV